MMELPIQMDPTRRWDVGAHCGDTFGSGEDFDGIALVIELRSPAEANAVIKALFDAMDKAP